MKMIAGVVLILVVIDKRACRAVGSFVSLIICKSAARMRLTF